MLGSVQVRALCVGQVLRGAMGASRFPMFSEYIESNTDKNTDTGFYMGEEESLNKSLRCSH